MTIRVERVRYDDDSGKTRSSRATNIRTATRYVYNTYEIHRIQKGKMSASLRALMASGENPCNPNLQKTVCRSPSTTDHQHVNECIEERCVRSGTSKNTLADCQSPCY
ncbi:hypothetical protein Tcan_07476 [Toxocara canis]|uniref:Uncharacterized protein n=1 Tax=Toxocara canis TaxID=6265 RepID=A0A0B2VP84_TOXCA|nr:hypothetical protein Tcan_07476 [Toxocara canis]